MDNPATVEEILRLIQDRLPAQLRVRYCEVLGVASGQWLINASDDLKPFVSSISNTGISYFGEKFRREIIEGVVDRFSFEQWTWNGTCYLSGDVWTNEPCVYTREITAGDDQLVIMVFWANTQYIIAAGTSKEAMLRLAVLAAMAPLSS